MPGPTYPWPRRVALLLLAFTASLQITNAVSFERFSRRMLQNGAAPLPPSARKGMGWVVTNFPLKIKATCDATFYHSPLVLNVSRPDRDSFCFTIKHDAPEVVKYSCQQPASVNQVNRVQVLTAPGCGYAVAGITIDGRPWTNFTYDNVSNILSIDRIASLAPLDPAKPADRTVCLQLRGSTDACGSVTSFCAPTFGPDPACAVLVGDVRGDCCPVNRVSYSEAPVGGGGRDGGLVYRLSARLTTGCEAVSSPADLQTAIAAQYRAALSLPAGSFQFLSYSCRANRLAIVFRVSSLTMNEPDLIGTHSAVLLKPLASVIGLIGVRASEYTLPPSPPVLQYPTAPEPARPVVPAHKPPRATPTYGSVPPPVYGAR